MEFRSGGVVIVCMWKLFLFCIFGGFLFDYYFVCFTIVLFHAVEIVITFPDLISSRNNKAS